MKGCQIEGFFLKILNGHENIDPYIFVFKIIKTGEITRGHDFALEKGQSKLDVIKYPFSQRTTHEWNKLSTAYILLFKNMIDNYIVSAG